MHILVWDFSALIQNKVFDCLSGEVGIFVHAMNMQAMQK